MSTQTITEFLKARIAEDEQLARDAIADDMGQDGGFEDAFDYLTKGELLLPSFGEAAARMIVWNTPRRVLAECAAKRAIIEEHYWRSAEGARGCGLCNYSRDYGWEETGPCKTVRALAAVYKDHPDYQQEWAL